MAKRRIIINIESDEISDQEASRLVHSVISEGKVSKAGGKEMYCFLTEFYDRKMVSAHPYCKNEVFTVWRRKPAQGES